MPGWLVFGMSAIFYEHKLTEPQVNVGLPLSRHFF